MERYRKAKKGSREIRACAEAEKRCRLKRRKMELSAKDQHLMEYVALSKAAVRRHACWLAPCPDCKQDANSDE
jgi:hypothetical protein